MQQDESGSGRFEVHVTSDSHFSWLRTRMSAERTLMSWLRTSVSMIGFGFTIVQFFEHFGGMQGVKSAVNPGAPRVMGLTLIAIGTAALVVAAWQYKVLLDYLWSQSFRPIALARRQMTPAYAISIVMVAVGIFTFVAVLTRLGSSG